MQMLAYLILKLLNNIYQSLDVRDEKKCPSETKTSFGSRETYLESLSKVLGRKIIFYVFTSEISLVIFLHDWFTLDAPAADKNCIHYAL